MSDIKYAHLYTAAHKLSDNHRLELEQCGSGVCFFCGNKVQTTLIKEWIDKGQTALCHHCGIDAVLPDNCDLPINDSVFISEMYNYWFGVTRGDPGE